MTDMTETCRRSSSNVPELTATMTDTVHSDTSTSKAANGGVYSYPQAIQPTVALNNTVSAHLFILT